jgi:hypothetical protein
MNFSWITESLQPHRQLGQTAVTHAKNLHIAFVWKIRIHGAQHSKPLPLYKRPIIFKFNYPNKNQLNSLYLFILWLQTVEVDGELHQGGRLHPPGRQLDKQVVVEDDRADGREPRRKIAVGAAQLVVAEVEVLQPWQSENCDRHTREVVAGHVQ